MSQYSRKIMWMSLFGCLLGAPAAIAEPEGAAPASKGQELESNFADEVAIDAKAKRAVTFNGCISPHSVITHRVTLPAFGSFLHRVVPDRRGFNVVMRIEYPGLYRTINQKGPGQPEQFTVRTPNGRVTGRVKISGLRGSFGCYRLRVTP